MSKSIQILDKNEYFIIKLTVFTLLLGKIPYAVLGDIAEFKYSDPKFLFFILKDILLIIIFFLVLTKYKNNKIKNFIKFYLLSNVICIFLIYINKFNITSIIFFLKNITLPSILVLTAFFLREKTIVRIFTYVLIINLLFAIYQLNFGVESETGVSKHLYLDRPKGATDNPNTLALILFFCYSFYLQNKFALSLEKYDDYYKNKIIFYHFGLIVCFFVSFFVLSFATTIATCLLIIFICIYYFFLNKFKIAIIFFTTQLISCILSINILFLFYKPQYKIFSYKIFYLTELIKNFFQKSTGEIIFTENFIGSRVIDYKNFFVYYKNEIFSKNSENNLLILPKDKSFFNFQEYFNNIIYYLFEDNIFSNQVFFYDSDFLNLIDAFGILFVIIFGTFIFYIFCEQNINKKKNKYQNVEKINIFLLSIVILIITKKFIPLTVANYFFFIILGYRISDVVNNFKNKKKFV